MAEADTIRTVAVDDHQLVRRGIRYSLLAVDDIELVGEAADGIEAVQICVEHEPDVVLLDMHLPGRMDGPATARAILEQLPETQIIALSTFYNQELVQEAMQSGITSYLVKGISVEELTDAIRAANAGRTMLTSEAVAALVEPISQPAPVNHSLTDRELDVLALLVEGLSNAQIAEQMIVSVATVKYHVRNILSKLGAANRTEAARLALEQDLIAKRD